jgi:hypothetical protein
MTSWLDRLRIALILSPAFLLLHTWILAASNGAIVQKLGMPMAIAMVLASSIIEAYIVVLAANTAIKLWQAK